MAAANIVPTAGTDGIVYANAVPLTPTEASLGDVLKTPDPIIVAEGQAVVAVVKLSINGFITGNSTFIALQTDLGDGTWIDVAWLVWMETMGSATFVLVGSVLGQANTASQQSRKAGSMPEPQSTAAASVILGGRCRFAGFAKMTGGSSSAPGVSTQVTATITYRLQKPR